LVETNANQRPTVLGHELLKSGAGGVVQDRDVVGFAAAGSGGVHGADPLSDGQRQQMRLCGVGCLRALAAHQRVRHGDPRRIDPVPVRGQRRPRPGSRS